MLVVGQSRHRVNCTLMGRSFENLPDSLLEWQGQEDSLDPPTVQPTGHNLRLADPLPDRNRYLTMNIN